MTNPSSADEPNLELHDFDQFGVCKKCGNKKTLFDNAYCRPFSADESKHLFRGDGFTHFKGDDCASLLKGHHSPYVVTPDPTSVASELEAEKFSALSKQAWYNDFMKDVPKELFTDDTEVKGVELEQLLDKYFKAKNWYDGETEQTLNAIKALTTKAVIAARKDEVKKLQANKDLWHYMTATQFSAFVNHLNTRLEQLNKGVAE